MECGRKASNASLSSRRAGILPSARRAGASRQGFQRHDIQSMPLGDGGDDLAPQGAPAVLAILMTTLDERRSEFRSNWFLVQFMVGLSVVLLIVQAMSAYWWYAEILLIKGE